MDRANYMKDLNGELLYRSGQLAYFQSTVECDHSKADCLKFWNGVSSDGRFFIIRDRMMGGNDESNHTLKDVFSNKECDIEIPSATAKENYFWPLTHDTGLLAEKTYNDASWTFRKFSLSLMQLDWAKNETKKIHTITIEDQRHYFYNHIIITSAMNPNRFLLECWRSDDSVTLRIGQIHNNEILLEGDILSTEPITYSGFSFYGNTLYRWDPWYFELHEIYINVTRLDRGAQTLQITLDAIPDQFSTVVEDNNIIGCLAIERLYLAVQHKETKNYGIIWTDFKTRKWELIGFCVEKPITRIKFMPEGHFICIQTTENETKMISHVHQVQKTFYRIPLKKPEKLSTLAWFSLVRSKSKLRGVNPYKEAEKYLPYTSDIRCPFEK